jgi:predicted transcriptional regulator
MSDKQLALESIQRLPDDASLEAIAERLEFLAAIRKGLNQIERGETVRTRKSNANSAHGSHCPHLAPRAWRTGKSHLASRS